MKLFEHPDYTENKDNYETWHELYEGDQDALKASKYLWLHELETKPAGAGIRKLREQRSSYTNWAEVLVSVWTSILMRKDPLIPDDVKNLLGEQIADVDGEGSSLTSFIRDKIVANTFIYGKPIVKVDALGDKPQSKADEVATSYRPFMEIIDPRSFRDWAVEKKDTKNLNKLKFCRLEYWEYSDRERAIDPVKEKIVSKEYCLIDGKLTIIKYELVDEGKKSQDNKPEWKEVSQTPIPDWDEIPIVYIKEGISWLRDVSPHILKYYNTESVIDNVTLMQGHQRIFVIGDVSNMEVISLSESGLNSLPLGSTIQVIAPTDTTGPERRLQTILGNIIRVGLNQLKLQIEGQAIESAETLQQVKDNTVGLIQAELENVENVINTAVNLWAKYKGQDDFNSEIKFDIEDIKSNVDGAVKIYMAFRDEIAKLPMVRKELLNWVVDELNLGSPDDLKEEISEMIDATGDEATRQALEAEIRQNVVDSALDSRNGNTQIN